MNWYYVNYEKLNCLSPKENLKWQNAQNLSKKVLF